MLKNQYKAKLSEWKALVGQKGKKAKTALSPAHRLREIAELEAELSPNLPPFREGQTVGEWTIKGTKLLNSVGRDPSIEHSYLISDGITARWVVDSWLRWRGGHNG